MLLKRSIPRIVRVRQPFWRCLMIGLCCTGWQGMGTTLRHSTAQESSLDRVVIINPTTSKEQTLSGRIVDYNGQFLRLQRPGGGRELRIESQRVRKIRTSWTANHLRGDQLLANHKFEQALVTYQQAVKEETRNWARQRILAQWVRCYQSQGQIEQAGDTFLKLVLASDPNTLYFHTMPLNWGEQPVSATLEGQAQVWITNSQSGAARLMGASWLLGTAQGGLATQVLKQLTIHEDTRLALLAEAQLWRSQQATVSMQALRQWEQQVSRLPVELRAGPYYLLGRASSRHQEHEQAIVSWMRIPISYPHHFHLAAEALLAAAKELGSMQREQQARNLYQEIVRKYANTIAAREAQRKLDQTGRKSQPIK